MPDTPENAPDARSLFEIMMGMTAAQWEEIAAEERDLEHG